MNHKPTVSVIMPVYNGEEYLREAIDSVLNQTYKDFEFILINDGSTDGTQKIIESYNDPRLIPVNQKNQGVARSLNNALKMAKGKYIRRHDADDISLRTELEEQVQFMEDNPEFALLSNQIAYMTDRGKKAHKYRNPQNRFFKNKPYRVVDYQTYKKYRPVIHATVLMKTDVVNQLGGYRTEFLTSEDVDLWLRFLDNHKIAVLNSCKYFVRLHSTSATKAHSSSVDFYRNLAIEYAEERRRSGSDPLMRGESISKPIETEQLVEDIKPTSKGKNYRDDLDFYYNLLWNAGDFKNLKEVTKVIISDG